MIAFSTAFFAGWPFALADMLTMILQDLEDHSSAWSSFELTSEVRISSEHESRAEHSKRLSLCAHRMCYFRTVHLHSRKFSRVWFSLSARPTFSTKLFPDLRYCLYTTGIIISLPLCSNQVDRCRAYNAKIIEHGKDIGEAKELATKIAEEEGLQYVNG